MVIRCTVFCWILLVNLYVHYSICTRLSKKVPFMLNEKKSVREAPSELYIGCSKLVGGREEIHVHGNFIAPHRTSTC